MAAQSICEEAPAAALPADPRHSELANRFHTGLADSLRSTPGLIHKMVERAVSAAADLNVEPFQGLVGILQNADDVSARCVRFALISDATRRRPLIVHDRLPVAYHHVAAMILPNVMTKPGQAEQKGRFGIGLKTPHRIARRVLIHSAPYHFVAKGLQL
jgi:hypothetical protein